MQKYLSCKRVELILCNMMIFGIFIIIITSNAATVSGKECCDRILRLNDTSGTFEVSSAHANRTCLQVIPTLDDKSIKGVLIEINDLKNSIEDKIAESLRESNPANCLLVLFGKRCDSWDEILQSKCHGSVENRTIYRETDICLEASTSSNSSAIVYEQLEKYSGYLQNCVDIDEVTTDSQTSTPNALGTTSAPVSISTARDWKEHSTSGATTGGALNSTLYWLQMLLISAIYFVQ